MVSCLVSYRNQQQLFSLAALLPLFRFTQRAMDCWHQLRQTIL